MTDMKPDGRRHDLDALRVASFGTLIIFHTSLLYGTKPWLLKSYESSRLIDLITVGSHPWRMSLLFFISGLVTASLLKRKSVDEIRRARTRQLLLPFILGVYLVVPPQIYLSQFNPFPEMSYWEFWKAYVVSGLTLEHMWFIAYLWIYIFLWSIALPRLEKYRPDASSAFASRLRGVNLFLIPILFLSVIRLFLYPIFGETLVITTDVYAHVLYFSMFMAGTLLMDKPTFWDEIDRQRWTSFTLALVSLLMLATAVITVPREQWPDAFVVIARVVRSIFQWCTIIALLAFAKRLLNRPSRVVAYLNKSIMTYYVLHQTVIVIAAYHIAQAGLLDIRSFIPIVIVTALVCLLLAEAHKLLMAYVVPRIFRFAASRRVPGKPPLPEAAG